jgi:hypothetical protein
LLTLFNRKIAAKAKRSEAERKAVADAQKIVAIWNARQAGGRALWFYPTIGAAIAAGLSWLSFSCRPAVSLARLICARSTAIPARRFRASSHQCHVAGVRRTHRSRDWKC